MKKIVPILSLIVLVILSSCDGRDKAFRTAENDLIENKVLDSFNENIKYIPEGYAEKVTDTIFSNGYTVSVKMYTDMNNHITSSNTKDRNIQYTKYRDFSLNIKVIKAGKTILNRTFNKQHMVVFESLSRLDLNTYYLRDFWIAKDNKQHPEIPAIYFEYYSPTTKESSVMEIVPLDNTYLFVEI